MKGKANKEEKKMMKSVRKVTKELIEHRKDSTKEQRDSWKRVLVKAYRKEPPKTEKKLLEPLRKLNFIHQYLVCGYIADFAHLGEKVIIEFDGFSHNRRKEYDAKRDRVLCDHGWRVLRFSNEFVNNSPSSVLEKIRESIQVATVSPVTDSSPTTVPIRYCAPWEYGNKHPKKTHRKNNWLGVWSKKQHG